jgi:hypothetical protein
MKEYTIKIDPDRLVDREGSRYEPTGGVRRAGDMEWYFNGDEVVLCTGETVLHYIIVRPVKPKGIDFLNTLKPGDMFGVGTGTFVMIAGLSEKYVTPVDHFGRCAYFELGVWRDEKYCFDNYGVSLESLNEDYPGFTWKHRAKR